MADTMLKFVKLDKRMPDKRDADTRRADFDEIYGNYAPNGASEQISPRACAN